jgi:predicted amidophosphoribosyltransferase
MSLDELVPDLRLMPARCPYCARPLRGLGLKCRACRRYVLRWYHVTFLAVVSLAIALLALEEIFRFI